MKVDADLRLAINAAARAQRPVSHEQEEADEKKAVNGLITLKSVSIKKARQLRAKWLKLSDQAAAVDAELDKILKPLGLRFENRNTPDLELGYGESSKQAFVKAGGILPPAKRRKWTADEVIQRLVGVKPDKRDAILKECGIDWS